MRLSVAYLTSFGQGALIVGSLEGGELPNGGPQAGCDEGQAWMNAV